MSEPNLGEILKAAAKPDLEKRAANFRIGTKRLYDGERQPAGDGDMWLFELWHFLGDVETAMKALKSRWCTKCCATSANDTRCGVCDTLLIVDMAQVRNALNPQR